MRRARPICLTDVKPPGRIVAVRRPTLGNQPADFRLALVDEIGASFGVLPRRKRLARGQHAAADPVARVDDGDGRASRASSRAAVRPASPAPAIRTETPRMMRAASVVRSTSRPGKGRSSLAFVLPRLLVSHARDDMGARFDAHRRLQRDRRRYLARHPRAEHAGRAVRQIAATAPRCGRSPGCREADRRGRRYCGCRCGIGQRRFVGGFERSRRSCR